MTAQRLGLILYAKRKRTHIRRIGIMVKETGQPTTVRLTASERAELEKQAEARGMSLSDLLKIGAKMFAGFEPYFLERVQKVTGDLGIDPAIGIQQLLLYYIAHEAAILKVFGAKSQTWARAFQVDADGLVRGSRLSERVYAETEKEALAFRKRIESWAKSKTKEPFLVRNEDAAMTAEARL